MKGHIKVISEMNKGTVFILEIPVLARYSNTTSEINIIPNFNHNSPMKKNN